MQITITKRKTRAFRLSVNQKGEVKLSAPLLSTKSQIDNFIQQNKQWLTDAINKVLQKQEEQNKKLQEFANKAPYLGNWLELEFCETIKKTVIENNKIITKNHKMLQDWYKKEALRVFEPKCHEIASFYNVQISKIGVRFAKSRWGSCSQSGIISLNTHLIKAPRRVIEYVIIHEISHLKELNHSKRFWDEVKRFCPEYKVSEKWLKEHGWMLMHN